MLGHQVELADYTAGLCDVAQSGVNRVHALGSGGERHRQNRGLHGDLGLGLDLAQLLHSLAGPGQQLGGGTGGGLDVRIHNRPSGAVHGTGTGVHPAPHLFRGVRQVWSQQTSKGIQAQAQRGAGGLHGLLGRHIALLVRSAIGTVLDQLDVVVAELPEVGLDDLKRLGVLVSLQCFGGLSGFAHVVVLVLAANRQCKLRGVQQLDGQSTADLHLADVIRGIEA